MVRVVATWTVLLRPQLLDEDVGAPALECAGTLLDALDRLAAGDGGFVGEAYGGVEAFLPRGPDCGGCEEWFAEGWLLAEWCLSCILVVV